MTQDNVKYYRVELIDEYGDNIGGIVTASFKTIPTRQTIDEYPEDFDELTDEERQNYFRFDDLMHSLMLGIKSPGVSHDSIFAFTSSMYDKKLPILKEMRRCLKKMGKDLTIKRISTSDNNIRYHDDTQIAFGRDDYASDDVLLTEAKADQERFKNWLYQYGNTDLKQKEEVLGQYLDFFMKNKNSIKSPMNDIYYWMKNKTQKEFIEFVIDTRNDRDDRKDKEKKEKEGARLIYSDNDWKVYSITNYEASAKYGKGTKWCISGSKRWRNGERGEAFFNDYTSKGIKFYFFINDNTKYALALYPDNKTYEIFNAEDNKVAYIPNAPVIDEINVNYYSSSDRKEAVNGILSNRLPTDTLIMCVNSIFDDLDNSSKMCKGAKEFCYLLNDGIPDGYIEFLSWRDGELSDEEYADAIGVSEEFISDDWGGDWCSISDEWIFEQGMPKEELCNPNNYKEYKYFMFEDTGYDYVPVIYDDFGELILGLNSCLDIQSWTDDDLDDFYSHFASSEEKGNKADVLALMILNTLIEKIKHNEIADGDKILKKLGCSDAFIKQTMTNNEGLVEAVSKSEPTKKGIAYKVFKVKNGKLYPPMVANKNNEDTPIGVWLDAEEGEFAGLSKTGRPQVKSTGSGTLSYRPGWHLGDVPRASQFDRKNKETGEMEFPKDFVWAECEYAMDVDYQPESDARGYERTKIDDKGNIITYKSDKYQHSLAGVPHLPKNGYYKYRTNPNPDTVPWVITGAMKVNRLLSDDEVNAILKSKGIAPIHRQGGDKTLKELGLNESLTEDTNDAQRVTITKRNLWEYYNTYIKPLSDEEIIRLASVKTKSKIESKGPQFILSDGKIVNMYIPGDINTHEDILDSIIVTCFEHIFDDVICDYAPYYIGEYGILDDFTYGRRWIRINPGTPDTEDRVYCVLPNSITSSQYERLGEFFDVATTKSDKILIYATDEQTSHIYYFATNTSDEIVKNIRRFYASGYFVESAERINESEDSQYDDTIYYHGTASKFDRFSSSINWLTTDKDYAKSFATWSQSPTQYIYECKIKKQRFLDCGNTGAGVFGLMPGKYSDEMLEIAKKLNLDKNSLDRLVNDVADEFDIDLKYGYAPRRKYRIDVITRSTQFKRLAESRGYTAIKALEVDSGVPTVGIFNPDDIEIVGVEDLRKVESMNDYSALSMLDEFEEE